MLFRSIIPPDNTTPFGPQLPPDTTPTTTDPFPVTDPGVAPDTTDPFPVTDPGVAPDTTGDGSGVSPGGADYLTVLKKLLGSQGSQVGASYGQ